MNRIAAAAIFGFAALLAAAPASAVTLDNGVVLITQADALAGGVTPGDTPGFPITLTVSGSYRFASNLLVNTAVNGIDVNAPEVTIDLAGFRMAGSGVGLEAISSFQRALTVKNGTIRGFTSYAVASANNLTVDRMRIVDNPNNLTDTSIYGADYTIVSNSNISRNKYTGVLCFKYCIVRNNILAGKDDGYPAINPQGVGGLVIGNTASNFTAPIVGSFSVSIGDNVFIGNTNPSQATLLPLDPNQPPPPP